jgi:hypothetical protein
MDGWIDKYIGGQRGRYVWVVGWMDGWIEIDR